MLKNALNIEVTRYAMTLEEFELICTTMGFKRRIRVEHIGDGISHSVELEPS